MLGVGLLAGDNGVVIGLEVWALQALIGWVMGTVDAPMAFLPTCVAPARALRLDEDDVRRTTATQLFVCFFRYGRKKHLGGKALLCPHVCEVVLLQAVEALLLLKGGSILSRAVHAEPVYATNVPQMSGILSDANATPVSKAVTVPFVHWHCSRALLAVQVQMLCVWASFCWSVHVQLHVLLQLLHRYVSEADGT